MTRRKALPPGLWTVGECRTGKAQRIDMTGQVYGELKVVRMGATAPYVLVRCRVGHEEMRNGKSLRRGAEKGWQAECLVCVAERVEGAGLHTGAAAE
jgi:hypothetical protein